MDGLPLFLIPGYIYGIGYLISRFLLNKRDFVFAVFTSLTLWCIIGWYSFGYLKEMVYILSLAGTIGLVIGFKDLIKQMWVVVAFIGAILLRYMIIFPLHYPYGNDSIMHSYATYTIVSHGGFSKIIEPFGIEGFGNFNLGFHFVAAGLHYLSGFKIIGSVIFTNYIFWGAYFLALYHWLKDLRWAFMIAFITVRPSNFMAWGGFPTLASMSFSIFAFGLDPIISIPFWMGALSTHFITSIPALSAYILVHRKSVLRFRFILLFLGFTALLIPQYYHLIMNNFALQPYENRILSQFVLSTFPESALFAFIYLIMAFIGYDSSLRKRVPPYAILLPISLGIVSYLFALLDLKSHHVKGFYMARLYVPLIIPAIFGFVKIFKKFRFSDIGAFILGCALTFYSHKKYDKDPRIWKYVENCCKDLEGKWAYTRYGTEESFLPAFGIPAYMSHYLITQLEEMREFAKDKEFAVIFLRKNDKNPKVREIVEKYGILIKEFPSVEVYKLKRSVKGKDIF